MVILRILTGTFSGFGEDDWYWCWNWKGMDMQS
jgi:hypothetical protein